MASTTVAVRADEGVGQTFGRAAQLHGARVAVVDGERQVTYAELERRALGLSGGLSGLGLGRGDVVGVLSMNSLEHLECWLGIPAGGMVLNDLNTRLAARELEFILTDSEASALMVDDTFLDVGRQLAEACPSLRHLIHTGGADGTLAYEQLAGSDPAASVGREHDLAGIFYTGGTTGLPKGVMLTHGNLLANARHMLITVGYRPDDCYVHAGPMFHLADGAANYAISWLGARHVIIPAFEPGLLARTIAEQRVTVTTMVPTMINLLVHHPAATEQDLSSLRKICYGGSPMPPEVQRAAFAAIDCEWLQLYGMTEAAPLVTACQTDARRVLADEEPDATHVRSAGVPVVGVRAEVRRPDGSRAEAGEPGEIWVRGPNVMAGYWRRPAETAAALDEEGWYRSGDAAYADEDGYLYVVDRVKDMIISGGENVYCTDVENAIYEHPAVVEATVFGVPDERWGERVHAVVVHLPDVQVDEAALIAHCRERIAGYKLPRSVELRVEPLPKSGAGKILKRELREPHWAGHDSRVS
ncbi:MAG TPA: long-chain-fatty-acid--CoA ligase [Solirubrobacteraceae bacterium]|nr:long-chain-fatty-acid--CoA ligase [Solirubrobacteraceae bacterium]